MKSVIAFAPGLEGSAAARSLAHAAARDDGAIRVECGLALDVDAQLSGLVEIWGPGARELALRARPEGLLGAWMVDPCDPVTMPPPTAKEGTGAVPGLRLVSLCKRIDAVDAHAFRQHWHGEHRAIALSFAVRLSGYRQDVVSTLLHGMPIDGVAGLHFRSREHFAERYSAHPEDATRGARDAARFMDVAHSPSFFSSVTVELATPPPPDTRA